MCVYRQLNQIRIEKKSPLFVRKSKSFSWLLTSIALALFASFIGVLIATIVISLNLSNFNPNQSSNVDYAIDLLNLFFEPFNLLSISLTLYSISFILFFILKIVACIFNMIRYYSDYKRNVVPLKHILINRMVFQVTMIILLLVGIIFSWIGMIKFIMLSNNGINDSLTIIRKYMNIITALNQNTPTEEIENVINQFKNELQTLWNNIMNDYNNLFPSKFINYIIVGFSFKISWVLVLIVYGINIKILLSKNKKYFGDDSLKTITIDKKKNKDNFINKNKENLEINKE